MIKLVFCCRRNPALSAEEFYEHWLENHAALVRSVSEQLPQMLRYVQSHTIAPEVNQVIREGRGSGEPYDGITEVWFARCSVFLTEEHVVF